MPRHLPEGRAIYNILVWPRQFARLPDPTPDARPLTEHIALRIPAFPLSRQHDPKAPGGGKSGHFTHIDPTEGLRPHGSNHQDR